MMDFLVLITLIVWPVIPLFWIPVHLFPRFFRKIKLLTYIMPPVIWLPVACMTYQHRDFLLYLGVDFPVIVRAAGIVILLAGTGLHIYTARLLGLRGLIGMPEVYEKIQGKFAVTGAFSVVRHPTYFAHTAMFTGVFLASGVISVGILAAVDFLVVNIIIIPLEENELLSRFGDEYREYSEKVPRFFPRPIPRLEQKTGFMIPGNIEKYVAGHTSPVSPLLEELERETIHTMKDAQMLIGAVEGRLLQMLVTMSGAAKVVEIGTFTGYSALMMAEGLPEDGELVTCEISEERAAFARRYFMRSPHGKKIRLKVGPGLETLGGIPDESVDFIFIDADKTSYTAYYGESMRILKRGGLIVADNALWGGKVLHPDDPDSRGIALFNETVRKDLRVEKVMLALRDGAYLIRKKNEK